MKTSHQNNNILVLWEGLLIYQQNSPIPGTYHIRDFIEEMGLNPVTKTYGFKSTGRDTLMMCVRRGDVLLPGAYNFTDSTNEALRRQATYSFKNCARPDNYTLGIRDKVSLSNMPSHKPIQSWVLGFSSNWSKVTDDKKVKRNSF